MLQLFANSTNEFDNIADTRIKGFWKEIRSGRILLNDYYCKIMIETLRLGIQGNRYCSFQPQNLIFIHKEIAKRGGKREDVQNKY